MNRKILPMFLSLIMMVSVNARADVPTEVPGDIERNIRGSFPGTKIHAIKVTPLTGVYELQMGKNIAYTGPGGRYMVIGHMFDTHTGTDLSATPLWEQLPKNAAIISGTPNGLKLALLTDPDCNYCRTLEKELMNLPEIELHTYINPIPSIHPMAVEIARAVWCENDDPSRIKMLRDYMLKQIKPSPATCAAPQVAEVMAFSKEFGLEMTPTLIRSDGAVLLGARPAAQILAWLKQTTSQTPEILNK